jgi:hypothetical protein
MGRRSWRWIVECWCRGWYGRGLCLVWNGLGWVGYSKQALLKLRYHLVTNMDMDVETGQWFDDLMDMVISYSRPASTSRDDWTSPDKRTMES